MGKKGGSWLGAVKRALSPDCTEKKKKKDGELTTPKSKRKWLFGKSRTADLVPDPPAAEPSDPPHPHPAPPPPPVPPQATSAEEVKQLTAAEREQNKHVYSVALATAEAAVAAAQAAAEAVRLTSAMAAGFSGVSREELAAVKIQTAFRGFLARRALRALRGLVRLKSLMTSNAIKHQSTNTLHCLHTMARIQAEIHARRIRMNEDSQALQRHLQLKRERELEALKAAMDEDWDDTLQSKEQIETSLMNKYEAAIRRERAMAYAFSHQWKATSRSVNPTFIDPNNPQWGWSWLERWMAVKPNEKEVSNNDQSSVRSKTLGVAGEIAKAYARRHTITNRPGSRQSTSPSTKAPSTAGKIRPASPRGGWIPSEDGDSRSMLSIQSERCRRHSIAGSSVRDDESLASSPAVPNYMTPTESTRAKSRLKSPSSDSKNSTTPDRVSVGSAKKRLSFPVTDRTGLPSPAGPRRHSGPPKIDTGSVRSTSSIVTEQAMNNNGVTR